MANCVPPSWLSWTPCIQNGEWRFPCGELKASDHAAEEREGSLTPGGTLERADSLEDLQGICIDSSWTPQWPPGPFLGDRKHSFSCNDLTVLAQHGSVADGAEPVGGATLEDLIHTSDVKQSEQAEEYARIGKAIDARLKGTKKKRVLFCCHGSRGDVQPLVAMALGFRSRGYEVAFWTVNPVNTFVEGHDIPCFVHDLDTDELMRRVQTKVANGAGDTLGGGLGFFASTAQVLTAPDIKPKIEAIPASVLAAHLAYHPDIVITSHCMPAISCAEKLHVPVVYIALQPMYPTRHFPPFAFSSRRFQDHFSWLHKPLGQLFMSVYENQTYTNGVRKCRQLAGLNASSFQDGTPVYNLKFVPTCTVVSESLVPQPDDWPKWQKVCGFLMMDGGQEDTTWSPPDDLTEFLAAGEAPVYIGYGSMCGDEKMAVRLTRVSLSALMRTGRRGILLGGWAGMTRKRLDPSKDADLIAYAEKCIFELPSCPHSWLFPRCAAVVHHGGAGTLAAGLRAGCPTVICPFIFDQEYFGGLVQDSKTGAVTSPARDLTTDELSTAITRVLTDPAIQRGIKEASQQLMAEHGVSTSIDFVEEVARGFPFPWTIKTKGFARDGAKWASSRFKHSFSKNNLRLVDIEEDSGAEFE